MESSILFQDTSNEFVVKNPERVKIRYIVELRDKTTDELKKNEGQSSDDNLDLC